MNQTIIDILSWIGDHIIAIIVVLSIFFEISKIKINPISWLMRLLFRPLKKDMDDTQFIDTAKVRAELAKMEKKENTPHL